MDFKKIFIENANPTKVGGQAVMEGIVMKGEERTALCIRMPDDRLYIETEKLKPTGRWHKVPIIRGVLVFVDSLVSGMVSLTKSAELLEAAGAWDEEDDDAESEVKADVLEGIDATKTLRVNESRSVIEAAEVATIETEAAGEIAENEGVTAETSVGSTIKASSAKEEAADMEGRTVGAEAVESLTFSERFFNMLENRFGEGATMKFTLTISVVFAIIFTVGIFIILPTWAMKLFDSITDNAVALNFIEGGMRIALFVLYIFAISRMKDIQTVFKFHGAEHECIHCYESGLELTPENCDKFETLHPRCGTSFLMFVMIIALLLFSLLGWPNLLLRITSRIVLIPVIAGLSYELLRWAGRSTSPIVKVFSVPGLLLQKITTLRPDEKQLEVAIAAMKAVLVPAGTEVFAGYCDKNGELLPDEPDELLAFDTLDEFDDPDIQSDMSAVD